MVLSFFRRHAAWAPALVGGDGQDLFSEEFVLQLAERHVSEDASSAKVIEALLNPETRLGYELLPEVVAEYALREISPPEKFEYVLRDRSGGVHSFAVARHPITPIVHRVIDDGRLTHPALKLLGGSSGYSAAVSKALNAGEALANLSIAVAPIGVRLHLGKLETIEEH